MDLNLYKDTGVCLPLAGGVCTSLVPVAPRNSRQSQFVRNVWLTLSVLKRLSQQLFLHGGFGQEVALTIQRKVVAFDLTFAQLQVRPWDCTL